MKKIVYLVGILFLTIVFCLNLFLTANLDVSEHITINTNIIIPKGNFFLLLLIISLPFLSSTKPANAGLYFSYCFG